MVKRRAEDALTTSDSVKRQRLQPDRLSTLSDEILLRIFSNLTVQELNLCQRVSSHIRRLAGDSELWKSAYYNRFVRPRLDRLVNRKSHRTPVAIGEPSRRAQWLDEDDLLKKGVATNWKRQYRIRHNWSRGACDVSEIPVSHEAPAPPLLARLQDGIIFTVDAQHGLRAWAYKEAQNLLGTILFEGLAGVSNDTQPTSIALNPARKKESQEVAVGFADGSLSLFTYNKHTKIFAHGFSQTDASSAAVTALAFTFTHMLSMNDSQVLSLYRLGPCAKRDADTTSTAPVLLKSLKSQTAWSPLSVSMRSRGTDLLACIAYCMPTCTSGWSTGIQEILFSKDGDVLESRVASAATQGFTSLAREAVRLSAERGQGRNIPTPSVQSLQSRPTSLSYSHPYLLISHSDNTMTLHMVTSTSSHLSINPGRKLWGHTSSILGAHVGTRGKAVSVSARGDEIRVWELEGGLTRSTSADEALSEPSVQISAGKVAPTYQELVQSLAKRASGCGVEADSIIVTKGWVGFDEENVVVLRERQEGLQALTVYDFS